MKVPFQLRRRSGWRAALAVYLPTESIEALLGQCARLGLDPSGRANAVAGGFLLKLDEPTTRPIPGAVRLRALGDDLFLPADSELVPTLLDDEAEGLGRVRGLIFLPGGRVLGFDPTATLDSSALLVASWGPRRDWRSLASPPLLADRIEEIVVDRPDESADDLLEAGGQEIGSEPPRPPDSGPAAKLAGGAALNAGRGLVKLGDALGLKGLSEFGAGLVAKALDLAPRLTEGVFGKQAAALQALLDEFRKGNLDRALRHALPLGEPGGDRGADVHQGDRLPTHDLGYSLRNLLGPAAGKGSSVWLGGTELMAELTKEYRKAAEQATRAGDFRRAAFIYGMLLREYRAAAAVLFQGGLFHDAAIVYLSKLDDRPNAARAFEAAGEVDRALQLYRELGDHVATGDLLRRIGEDELALVEYRLAAEQLIQGAGGRLAAGDLLLHKAGRPDLALEHFAAGWAARHEVNAIPCALRIAALQADAGNGPALLTLLDEADAFFAPIGDDQKASTFYTRLCALAETKDLAAARDELRDRSRLGLAVKLRQQAGPGRGPRQLVSTLLTTPAVWTAAMTSDANFAVAARARQPAPPAPRPLTTRRERIHNGVVTAVCAAAESNEIFAGFETGEVFCYRADRNEVVRVAAYNLPVAALATDPEGRRVVIAWSAGAPTNLIGSYQRNADGTYGELVGTIPFCIAEPWLTPILPREQDDLVGVWDGQHLLCLSVAALSVWSCLILPDTEESLVAGLLVESGNGCSALLHDGARWYSLQVGSPQTQPCALGWNPGLPDGHLLRAYPLSVLHRGPRDFELAGLNASGVVYWSHLCHESGRFDLSAANGRATEQGYRAASLVRPGFVAALTRSGVDWLRGGPNLKFILHSTTPLPLPSAVACFPAHRTGELIVICVDGFIARVPIPNY